MINYGFVKALLFKFIKVLRFVINPNIRIFKWKDASETLVVFCGTYNQLKVYELFNIQEKHSLVNVLDREYLNLNFINKIKILLSI